MSTPRKNQDTSLGLDGRDFPSTQWSQFLTTLGADPARARARLENLARGYWKPVYIFIRTRWSKSNEDSKDLAQAFFLWVMESDFLSKPDPTRGRFRVFLKVALERFLLTTHRTDSAQKRGGAAKFIDLDGAAGDLPVLEIADGAVRTPGEALDEAWRRELLERATEDLETALKAEGKALYFQVFEDYFLNDLDEVDYKDLATRHGITPADVATHLVLAKRRFHEILRDRVAETVLDPAELRDELQWLLGTERA